MSIIAKREIEVLDNAIQLVSEGIYETDNGRVKTTFLQTGNEVIFENKGRKISWTPQNMRYVDEIGEEDLIYMVQEVPLEVKSNYARYNRSFPDVDDWFIQDNDRLKHQILIQGFQPDPIPWLMGNIEFCVGGKMSFDSDLRIVANGIEQVNPFVTEGSIQIYDEDRLIFELPQVVAFDSNLDRAMTFGKYRVYFNDQAEMMFDFIIDYEWMIAQERVYPIVIDPTVIVSSGYSTSGNGGRRATELSNGWMVVSLFNEADSTNYLYRSTDRGETWLSLCRVSGSAAGACLEADGTNVVMVFNDSTTLYGIKFDATTVTNVDLNSIKKTIDIQTAIGGISLIKDTSNNRFYVAFASKNATYSNGFNIRFVQSVDGSNWYTPSQVSVRNTTGVNIKSPSITSHQGVPIIIASHSIAGSTHEIICLKETGLQTSAYYNWTYQSIFMGSGDYQHLNPSVVKDKSNVLHVFWEGENLGGYFQTQHIRSSDLGATWGEALTVSVDTQKQHLSPSGTVDKDGKLHVVYSINSTTSELKRSTFNGATWQTPITVASIASSNDFYPNMLFSPSYSSILVAWFYKSGARVQFDKILLNEPPSPPTELNRTNYDSRDSAEFTWKFNDPYALDTQSSYRIQITDNGTVVFDSNKVTSTLSKHTLSASTLLNNKQYQWRVKTWDNLDVEGLWSEYSTFFTSQRPTVSIGYPIENTPHNESSLTINWTFSDPESEGQGAYQVDLLSDSNSVLWTTGKVSDSRSRNRTINYTLLNESTYKIKLTVWDTKDVASLSMIRTFNVEYTAPSVPVVVAATEEGKIQLTITNEDVTGLPTVVSNEVFRRVDFDWIRIGQVSPNGVFIDYTPAHSVVYEYKIRSNGSNGTSIESEIVSASTSVNHAVITMVNNPLERVKLVYAPSRSIQKSRERTISHFAGRLDPLPEYGDARSLNLDTSFMIFNKDELNILIGMADSGEHVLYRDSRGRREFVSLSDISITDESPTYYTVNIPMTRISYSEEV